MSITNSSPRAIPAIPARRPRRLLRQEVAELLNDPGPFLTAYLATGSSKAAKASIEAVHAAGLDPEVVKSLLAEAASVDDETGSLLVLMNSAGGAVVRSFPDELSAPLVEVTALPRLGILFEAEQRLTHHVLVVLADDGIEVITVPRHGAPTLHRAEVTDLDRQGELIAEAVEASSTGLLLLAGEQQHCLDVRRRLTGAIPIETTVEVIDDTDLGVDDTAAAVTQAVATHQARMTVATLRMWKFEDAHGLTRVDVSDTIRALRNGEARLLLIHDDPDDDRQGWFAANPDRIASDLDDGRSVGAVDDLQPARLPDVLLWKALRSGVPFHVLPLVPEQVLPGGVGAVSGAPGGAGSAVAPGLTEGP